MFTNTTGKGIYLNADKTAVVDADSPEAAHLLVGPEGEIPLEEARKYGLAAPAEAAPTETKAVRKPADK